MALEKLSFAAGLHRTYISQLEHDKKVTDNRRAFQDLRCPVGVGSCRN
jgi:hypothetical protein